MIFYTNHKIWEFTWEQHIIVPISRYFFLSFSIAWRVWRWYWVHATMESLTYYLFINILGPWTLVNPPRMGSCPRVPGSCPSHPWRLQAPFLASGLHFPDSDFHLPATSLHFLASNLEFPDMIDFGMNLSWMLAAFGVDLFMYFQMFYIAFSWHISECFLMHASNFVGSLLVRRTLADTYSTAWI